MSYQTGLNEFETQYIRFLSHVRAAIQKTFAEEARDGLTQKELAETLGVDAALICRRLSGPGNITLKTLSELYTAMGRQTLSNFVSPELSYTQLPPVKTGTNEVAELDDKRRVNPTSGRSNNSLYATA